MKKGFTLIEVLAVIVLLGMVSLIIYPNVNKIVSEQRNNIKKDNIESFIKAAKEYSLLHESELLGNENYSVSLQTLKNEGLIQDKKYYYKNVEMNGCITVVYDSIKQINNYEYIDNCIE